MAFPDEVVALHERARSAFRWVMRSRKFDRNGDDWEGEVVPAHDPGPSRARSRPARTWSRSCSARVAGRRAACNSGGDDGSRLLIAAREDSMGKEEKLSALAAGRNLYDSIRSILLDSRARAHAAVNSAMVLAYWQIGRAIVEDEQEGQKRGAYGKGVLKGVSERLTAEFGKGYSVRNLQQMKRFYDLFPNANALRSHLTWTHCVRI